MPLSRRAQLNEAPTEISTALDSPDTATGPARLDRPVQRLPGDVQEAVGLNKKADAATKTPVRITVMLLSY